MTITLRINGSDVEMPNGTSVLDAVNASGTYISQFCKDPDMKPIGACRTCIVQIDGIRGFPTSCSLPATDGMQVWTDSEDVSRVRRGVLELTQAMVETNPNGAESIRHTCSPRPYRPPATPSSTLLCKTASCVVVAPRRARMVTSSSAP